MISKLFPKSVKTINTAAERWIRISPIVGKGYALYDPVNEAHLGHILIDGQNFWIYDGDRLDIDEQEEVAGQILGYRTEMDQLIRTISF